MDNDSLDTEQKIQSYIESNIKGFKSFCFNAGAGAGKTYALVESLRFLLKNNLQQLQNRNQKIICITYTNVAQREISERLGQSDTVIVSTIHEQLWKMIKKYQKELVVIHKKHLEEVLNSIDEELNDTSGNCTVYARLDNQNKKLFVDFMIKGEIREFYYQIINLRATQFRESIQSLDDLPEFVNQMLSNVGNFKKIVSKSILQRKYQQCLENIESGTHEPVTYDSKSNIDRLHYMKFSHDTLLDYSCQLIESYPRLQHLIIDKYPYIFVDEYQDTSEKVIKIFACLHQYALTSRKDWLVGYFGDTAQNIYDDGVGERISEIHQGLISINKRHNRRSEIQIIEAINKIRNDKIKQVPIDDNKGNGSVALYYQEHGINENKRIEVAQQFLDNYAQYLTEIGNNSGIDCLVLTNKTVSSFSGFGQLYDLISQARVINYQDINTKLLSNDLDKLDESILQIYHLLDLRNLIINKNISYRKLFGHKLINISFHQAKSCVNQLNDIVQTQNLQQLIENVSNFRDEESQNKALLACFENILNLSTKDLKNKTYQQFIINHLHKIMVRKTVSEEQLDEGLDKIEELLSLDIKQWQAWYKYIKEEQADNIRYHTYHGTKGSEYENVAVIMEHRFGIDRNKFKNYFEQIELNKELENSMINTRNLVYVACSRAKRNLRVLYLDDIEEFKTTLERLFTQIHIFES